MSGSDDSGDKTEKPTPKRLDDARKKGQVVKSRDVTGTVGLIVWLGIAALAVGYAAVRFEALCEALFATIGRGWTHTGFAAAARQLGAQAAEAALMLAAMVLVPPAVVDLLADFLQAGPVLSFEKLVPKLENLNPVEGVKRMFSLDNLVELLKSIAKTALLFFAGWLLVRSALPDLVALARRPDLPAQVVGAMLWRLTLQLMIWTIALYGLVAVLDAAYQRYTFTKKLRMSLRDIKQEMKESEGDPHIKQHRRQMHQEWSQRNAQQAASNANVLIVNPTHIAIAIDYDRDDNPVPTIAAKAEGHAALAMREAAEQAGVPIVRNIPLARDLLARAEIGEIVPADLFDIIAEVILWAAEVRAEVDAQRSRDLIPPPHRRVAVPGEDLTRYPEEKPWTRSP
ncbi:MAG: type III secretion system export apparatus subunit SctU [Lautropia sp.]